MTVKSKSKASSLGASIASILLLGSSLAYAGQNSESEEILADEVPVSYTHLTLPTICSV